MLSELAITVIKGNENLMTKICEYLGIGEQAVKVHLRKNKPTGVMCTVGVIEIIKKETGLSNEQIISQVEQKINN